MSYGDDHSLFLQNGHETGVKIKVIQCNIIPCGTWQSEGQWIQRIRGGCDESWSLRSNATALAGFAITTTTP